MVKGGFEHGIIKKAAIFCGQGNSRKILINYFAGAKGEVPYFAIAHLSPGQTNAYAGGLKAG
jgi:hypothetical protein